VSSIQSEGSGKRSDGSTERKYIYGGDFKPHLRGPVEGDERSKVSERKSVWIEGGGRRVKDRCVQLQHMNPTKHPGVGEQL